MLLPERLLPLVATLRTLPLADRSRVLGQLILGAPGAGKTILLSLILLVDLLRWPRLPGVVLDPLGTLSEAFLFRLAWFLSEFPQGDDELLWQRPRYIELGGDFVTPFPIYSQRQGESLWEAGQRLITVLERASPQLVTSPLTWPATRRLAVNAGMLLTALGYGGLTEIESLLFQTLEWEKAGRFQEAMKRNPQAKEAVSYFRNSYLPLPPAEKSRLAGTFLDQMFMLTYDPKLRALFSASTNCPGIEWEEVEANRQMVILNFKGITDPSARRFAMQWIFESLYPHLKTRGRRKTPFVVTIDEFANLVGAGTLDNKPLADLFDEFLAQFARNNRVFLSVALQFVDQVDERLRQTLLRLGTIITGRAGSLREARVIGDHLVRKDIYRIHHHKKVWGKVARRPLSAASGIALPGPCPWTSSSVRTTPITSSTMNQSTCPWKIRKKKRQARSKSWEPWSSCAGQQSGKVQ
jgi:transposase